MKTKGKTRASSPESLCQRFARVTLSLMCLCCAMVLSSVIPHILVYSRLFMGCTGCKLDFRLCLLSQSLFVQRGNIFSAGLERRPLIYWKMKVLLHMSVRIKTSEQLLHEYLSEVEVVLSSDAQIMYRSAYGSLRREISPVWKRGTRGTRIGTLKLNGSSTKKKKMITKREMLGQNFKKYKRWSTMSTVVDCTVHQDMDDYWNKLRNNGHVCLLVASVSCAGAGSPLVSTA